MAGRVMMINDTLYTAGHVYSMYSISLSSMLSNFIDRHLVMTNVDLDGYNNYRSIIGWTRWAQIYLNLCVFGGPSNNSLWHIMYLLPIIPTGLCNC